MDTVSLDVGNMLRNTPMARLGFLLYLLFLHFWLFTVLAYQVHNFEMEHGDFGSYRHMEQLHGHPPGWKPEPDGSTRGG